MSIRLLFVAFLVALAGPLGANAKLTMKVSPSVSFAPANLTLRATILPDSRNRLLEVIAESDDYYRSSEIQLDGERAARTTVVNFDSVPGGVYQVSATLKGEGGDELAFSQEGVRVLDSGSALR